MNKNNKAFKKHRIFVYHNKFKFVNFMSFDSKKFLKYLFYPF